MLPQTTARLSPALLSAVSREGGDKERGQNGGEEGVFSFPSAVSVTNPVPNHRLRPLKLSPNCRLRSSGPAPKLLLDDKLCARPVVAQSWQLPIRASATSGSLPPVVFRR